jgi:vancomycin permeability regulator SanA
LTAPARRAISRAVFWRRLVIALLVSFVAVIVLVLIATQTLQPK